MSNTLEKKVISDFGKEWSNFDQSEIRKSELIRAFNQYFKIFPKIYLRRDNEGFDMGCGSGRWAKIIAPKVKKLNCIEPSIEALKVAKKNLKKFKNVSYYNAGVNENNLKKNSQNFGYCLGVLHHISNTQKGIDSCYKILKKNSPFLIYLYYRFDHKPEWFKIIWRISDLFRKLISKLPFFLKKKIAIFIAILVYYPFANIAKIFSNLGVNIKNFPLSDYKDKSFYFMKTDALDRFGTKLEKRFTKIEIKKMLQKSGFKNIRFSNNPPYWVAIAWKKN